MKFGSNVAIGRVRVFCELNQWDNTKTYPVGYRIEKDGTVFESLQNNNLNRDPSLSTSALFWLAVKKNNVEALFDESLSNYCASTGGNLSFNFRTSKNNFNDLAFLGIVGEELIISVVDEVKIFNPSTSNTLVFQTTNARYITAHPLSSKKQDYVVRDLPILGDRITIGVDRVEEKERIGITVTLPLPTYNEENPKIGEIVMGNIQSIGLSQYGASSGIISYSQKITDEFGNTTVVKRNIAKKMQVTSDILKVDINRVQSLLYSLESVPCVWIASADSGYSEPLIVYGFYKDFSNVIDYPSHSKCTIDIEGLT
jgi:hypothetical protein